MIIVPQSTVEKPLTALDYCAELTRCETLEDVHSFNSQLPLEVLQDDRYNRALAQHCSRLKTPRAA